MKNIVTLSKKQKKHLQSITFEEDISMTQKYKYILSIKDIITIHYTKYWFFIPLEKEIKIVYDRKKIQTLDETKFIYSIDFHKQKEYLFNVIAEEGYKIIKNEQEDMILKKNNKIIYEFFKLKPNH